MIFGLKPFAPPIIKVISELPFRAKLLIIWAKFWLENCLPFSSKAISLDPDLIAFRIKLASFSLIWDLEKLTEFFDGISFSKMFHFNLLAKSQKIF